MKELFPIFQKHPQLVYLDTAATAQKPQVVIDSLVDFYTTCNANIGRSVCALGDRASEQFARARQVVQNFINAASTEEIIFTKGATEAINLVAAILTETFDKGDEIILSELEHHSNLVPWQQAARRKGLRLKFIPILESGELDLEAYQRLLGPKVKLVAVLHLSNVLGTVSNIRQIIQLAQAQGALVLVDGTQAISKIVVDVQDLGCDFYAFSGHKIYGPAGVGVLYGKKECLSRLPAYQTGGKTVDYVELQQAVLAAPPAKYEAGTPNIPGAVALAAALEFVNQHKDQANLPPTTDQPTLLFAHEKELTDYAEHQLRQLTGVRVFGAEGNKLGVVAFVCEAIHSLDVATYLSGQHICLRAGHHCCQPLMRRLGVETSLRISFGVYNDRADIDYFVEHLHRAIQILS